MPLIRLSVRALVEFLLRSGDLDERRRTSDPEAMLKGGQIHRKLQKKAGPSYRAEVSLKLVTEREDFSLSVEGRADGIFQEEDQTWVEEIKGTYANIAKMEAPVPVHLAQAKCYAHFLCVQEKLSQVGVRMTYVSIVDEQMRQFREFFDARELKRWYEKLVEEYARWIGFQQVWRRKRNASMENLSFPFPYREGQRRLVTAVYHAIGQGQQLFACAPTGIGKTMSTIFPAVRRVGEGKGEMIFYLTAKTITRTVAMEAFSLLERQGLCFKVLVLTAKEKVCLNEKVSCNPADCPYARGHFDRVNEAVFSLLTSETLVDREKVREAARQFQVCPFELSLDLSTWLDAVICDYNYVFDPDVALKRFFSDTASGDYIFLIDEAHNLVSRARQMYSAALREEDLEKGAFAVAPFSKTARAFGRVQRAFASLEGENWQRAGFCPLQVPLDLSVNILSLQTEMEAVLTDPPREGVPDDYLELYFTVRSFSQTVDLLGPDYLSYLEREEGKKVLRLACMDPSQRLALRLSKGRSAVFFSATLLPLPFYRRLLSKREDDFGLVLTSPFPRENRLLLIGEDVLTRYRDRGYEQYRRIAEYLARITWQRAGNYIAFFPSYRMLQDVYEIYEAEFSQSWVEVLLQTPSMGEGEREEFLEAFEGAAGEGKKSLLAFAIMGGIFSEGIDFLGEKLIGAVVVGLGLPQVGPSAEALRYFFDARGEDGFAYAYRYPAMNKVLQAAGRVIRTREDKGVILLLDQRFGYRQTRSLFPEEWEDAQFCRLSTVGEKVDSFWKEVLP